LQSLKFSANVKEQVTAAQLRRRQTKTNESASLENMITNNRARIYARHYKDGGKEAARVSNCVS
jgi:hypothetical protein